MSDFSIDVDTSQVREALGDLKDDWGEAGTYVVGTNADYAILLEYGRGPVEADSAEALRFKDDNGDVIYRTSVSGHPPYPFFFPAVREFQANPESFVTDNSGYSSIREIPNVNQLVKAIATALVNQMEKNASAASASDRSPGVDPDHPMRDTGNLVSSISFERL